MRAPSTDREQRGPQPNKESSVGGKKEKQPVVQEEQVRNEGLTVFTAQRPGAAVWKGEQMVKAGHTEDPEKAQEQKKKDGAE